MLAVHGLLVRSAVEAAIKHPDAIQGKTGLVFVCRALMPCGASLLLEFFKSTCAYILFDDTARHVRTAGACNHGEAQMDSA